MGCTTMGCVPFGATTATALYLYYSTGLCGTQFSAIPSACFPAGRHHLGRNQPNKKHQGCCNPTQESERVKIPDLGESLVQPHSISNRVVHLSCRQPVLSGYFNGSSVHGTQQVLLCFVCLGQPFNHNCSVAYSTSVVCTTWETGIFTTVSHCFVSSQKKRQECATRQETLQRSLSHACLPTHTA